MTEQSNMNIETLSKLYLELALVLPESVRSSREITMLCQIEKMRTALEAIAEAMGSSYSAEYVIETDWNPEAHLKDPMVTLLIRDARLVYGALGYYDKAVTPS